MGPSNPQNLIQDHGLIYGKTWYVAVYRSAMEWRGRRLLRMQKQQTVQARAARYRQSVCQRWTTQAEPDDWPSSRL